jgi:hypothetical protein
MAIVSGTYETYQVIGTREDLSDIIANIAPTETPFLTALKTGKADNTFPEWQTDTLATAAANAQLEGDEATFTASVPTQRLGNRTQISRKTVIVTGSNEETKKAGRDKELAYQIGKRSKELKRDIELALCGKNAVTAGVSDSTARVSGGFETWVSTNVLGGTSYASVAKTAGQPNNAATITDGTQRALDEEELKSVLASAWTAGGQPTMAMVGAFNKRAISGFTGNATRTIDAGGKRLQNAIDVYAHDFGEISIVPNRFSRDRTCMLVDPEYWEMLWLRPIFMTPLAKTGDAEKRMLLGEWTLKASQEAASGKVADLLTS